MRRALRDTIVVELLAEYAPSVDAVPATLIAETLEYLIELSGTPRRERTSSRTA